MVMDVSVLCCMATKEVKQENMLIAVLMDVNWSTLNCMA